MTAFIHRQNSLCLIPAACQTPTFCPQYVVACTEGYVRQAWPSTGGCLQQACNPAFVGQ